MQISSLKYRSNTGGLNLKWTSRNLQRWSVTAEELLKCRLRNAHWVQHWIGIAVVKSEQFSPRKATYSIMHSKEYKYLSNIHILGELWGLVFGLDPMNVRVCVINECIHVHLWSDVEWKNNRIHQDCCWNNRQSNQSHRNHQNKSLPHSQSFFLSSSGWLRSSRRVAWTAREVSTLFIHQPGWQEWNTFVFLGQAGSALFLVLPKCANRDPGLKSSATEPQLCTGPFSAASRTSPEDENTRMLLGAKMQNIFQPKFSFELWTQTSQKKITQKFDLTAWSAVHSWWQFVFNCWNVFFSTRIWRNGDLLVLVADPYI